MSNADLLVIGFEGSDTASEALKALKELKKNDSIKYNDAVAVYKNEKGKVKLAQTEQKKGILVGSGIGLLTGVIVGGPIAWAAAGAAIGATAKRGLNDKALKDIANELEDGDSAIFMLVEGADWDAVEAALPEYKSVIARTEVTHEIIVGMEKLSDDEVVGAAVVSELED